MTTIQTAPGSLTSPTDRGGPVTDSGSLDKEAFLQLLVAQMQNQDPLSPMEGTEYVNQLATFTNVEQAIRQADAMDVVSMQLTGIAANEAIGLIGKEVTVKGNTLAFDGANATELHGTLEGQAQEVTVTVRDQNGNAVRTMTLGPQPGGTLSVPWDGRDEAGQLAPEGSYSVEMSARDASGNPVGVSQEVTGKVVGVSFDRGYPEVILDSGARAPISDLVDVAMVPGAPPSPAPAASATPPPSTAASTSVTDAIAQATIDAATTAILDPNEG